MAHSLPHIRQDFTSAGHYLDGPYCAPTDGELLYSTHCVVDPIPECCLCNKRQTPDHESAYGWKIIDGLGNAHVAPNPISEAMGLSRIPEFMRQNFAWLERIQTATTRQLGAIDDLTGNFYIPLYNCTGPNGEFGYNWFDYSVYVISSASGNSITIDATTGADPRAMYWGNSPMQVGDFVWFVGNNCARDQIGCRIVAITAGVASGLYPAKPTSMTLQLDQPVTPALTSEVDLEAGHSMYALIGRAYTFPPTYPSCEQVDDYFWGVKKVVEYEPGSTEFDTGEIVLKNEDSENCAVCPPRTGDDLSTFIVERQEADGTYTPLSLSVSTPRPSVAMYGNVTLYTKTAAFTLTVKFRSSVTGLALGDFSVAQGAATLSNLQGSGANYTVDVTGAYGFPVVIALAAGAATDGNGLPTAAMQYRVWAITYDFPLDIYSGGSDNNDPVKVFYASFGWHVAELTPAMFTLTNCRIVSITQVNSYLWLLSVVPLTAAGHTVALAPGAVYDIHGNTHTGTDSEVFTYSHASGGMNCWIYSNSNPITSDATIHCTAIFDIVGGYNLDGFVVGDLQGQNCKVTNFTKISETKYEWDLTPWDVGADVALTENAIIGITIPESAASYTIPEDPDFGQEEITLYNFAGNLSLEWRYTGPTCEITSLTEGGAAMQFHCKATFSKPVTGFVSGEVTVTNGTVVNFGGFGPTWEWDVLPTAAGAVTCSIAAGVALDFAGKGNQASNTLELTATTSDFTWLNITHAAGDTSHATCVSTLTIAPDDLADALSVRVTYFWESTRDDPDSCCVYSRRCKYSQPTYGNPWGVPGHGKYNWNWICTRKDEIPRPYGVSNYASACLLYGNCQYFTPLEQTDFLHPSKLLSMYREFWQGIPAALEQRYAGCSALLCWKFRRVSHASIFGFYTPVDKMKFYPQQTLSHFTPQECGHMGTLHGGGIKQGAIHLYLDNADMPANINTAKATDGCLARQIAGWTTRTSPITGGAMDDSDDPYGEFRNAPSNMFGAQREYMEPLPYDIGPIRHQSLGNGSTAVERVLISKLTTEDGLQSVTNGWWQWGALDADMGAVAWDSENAVYGALIRALPLPFSTDSGTNAGAYPLGIRRIETITGGYRLHVAPIRLTGIESVTIPGWGAQAVTRNWYSGGNAVGLPEWFRDNNYGVGGQNTFAWLWNALGPSKGARRGYSIQFIDPGGGFDLLMPFSTGYPHSFQIMAAKAMAGDVFRYDNGNASPYNQTEQYAWYDAYIAGVLGLHPYYKTNANKCDTLDIDDSSGQMAAFIAAGDITTASTFAVFNMLASVPYTSSTPTFEWTPYGRDEWAAIAAGDLTCINKTMGVYALSIGAARTLRAAVNNFCIGVTI